MKDKIFQLDVVYGQKYTKRSSLKYKEESLRDSINTFCKDGFVLGVRPHKISVEVEIYNLELIGSEPITKEMSDYEDRTVRFRVSVPNMLSSRTVTVRIRRIS